MSLFFSICFLILKLRRWSHTIPFIVTLIFFLQLCTERERYREGPRDDRYWREEVVDGWQPYREPSYEPVRSPPRSRERMRVLPPRGDLRRPARRLRPRPTTSRSRNRLYRDDQPSPPVVTLPARPPVRNRTIPYR